MAGGTDSYLDILYPRLQWQAFLGNGKKAKIVPIVATETLERKKRTIAVRVVDIFGNDAGATVEVSDV